MTVRESLAEVRETIHYEGGAALASVKSGLERLSVLHEQVKLIPGANNLDTAVADLRMHLSLADTAIKEITATLGAASNG